MLHISPPRDAQEEILGHAHRNYSETCIELLGNECTNGFEKYRWGDILDLCRVFRVLHGFAYW